MTWSWLHVSMVHLAVLGFPMALVIRIVNRRAQSRAFDMLALAMIIICCLISFLSYYSGPECYAYMKQIIDSGGASVDQIEFHAILGRVFFLMSVVLFVLQVIQFLNGLQGHPPGPGARLIPLLLLVALSLTGLYVAHEGGKIRRMDWNMATLSVRE